MLFHTEPITSNHEAGFIAWLNDDENSRTFIARSILSFSDNGSMFRQLYEMSEQSDFQAWIHRTVDNQVIAYAELKQSAKVQKCELELVYVVSKRWRGKSIATSLVHDILNSELPHKGRKIIAYVNTTNTASIRVLTNNNFAEVPTPYDGARYERMTYV